MYINNVGALRDVIEYHLSAAMLLKADQSFYTTLKLKGLQNYKASEFEVRNEFALQSTKYTTVWI